MIYDKILDLSQQILQYQNFVLTAVLGITALLIASTWLWNFFFSKRQIKNSLKEISLKMEKELTKKIDTKMSELEDSFREKLRRDLLQHDAEINRLYALLTEEKGFIDLSITRWINVLRSAKQNKGDQLIRLATDNLLRNMKKEKAFEGLNKNQIKEIKKNIENDIPNILEVERSEMIKILSEEEAKK